MNIVVISGGSGNDALIKGIKEFYPECDVKVIVNAYDAGKSTGVCRQVTDTLGVSDIRKNHIRMYKATTNNINQSLVEFYDARYNFTPGNELNEVIEKLQSWCLDDLIIYAKSFFSRNTSKEYTYNDFNVSNIIYAEMYSQVGYEATNRYFCNRLGIDDFVILNSFDNIYIKAVTESGRVIEDEGDLVEYCNPDDIIVDMQYDLHGESSGLNARAIAALYSADLVIISTGTFWSSIYPTLAYCDFYKHINDIKARKIWAMNNEPDKDCYGVGSNRLIKFVEDLGLDLSDVTILENTLANPILREDNTTHDVVYEAMGNVNGKHCGDCYARAVLKHYYRLKPISEYSRLIFDFDDTLWARGASTSYEDRILMQYSRNNIQLINEMQDKAVIVSGNSYASIQKKLSTIYGSDVSEFGVDVWADANSMLFKHGERIHVIPELVIKENTKPLIEYLINKYGITVTQNDIQTPTCLKIKPLSRLDQVLLADYLNNYVLDACGLTSTRAIPAGLSTVDIITRKNNKSVVLDHINIDNSKALYIGDEIDQGNDAEISYKCGNSIHTSGIQETNALLRLLLNR